MKHNDYLFILKSFFIWRVLLFIPIYLSQIFIPLNNAFLGGGLEEYIKNPYFWSWANFDGEHYISIAKMGYGNGEQAFFPFYPLIIRFITHLFEFTEPYYFAVIGLLISNIAFILGLIGFYKLIRIDFNNKVAKTATLLLLFFPTSFYFAGVYTESLFFCLIIWSFYALRHQNYFLASVLGMFSTATRIVGIVILPIYLISMVYWKRPIIKLINLALIPTGVTSYMCYLYIKWQDPIKFFHAASGFGEQRSDHLIILPQVFYRYFFKIIPNVSWSYFPVIFTTLLETVVAILFLGIILMLFYHLLKNTKVVKSSYWLYLVFAYLIPTLSGSFSSLPRYALVLFPAFIYSAYFLHKSPKLILYLIYVILAAVALVAQMLFARGYFVS